MYILKLLVILHLLLIQIEATRKIFAGKTPLNTKAIPIIVQITVFLSNKKQPGFIKCGGSYIQPHWVLSATHCIKKQLPLKNHKPKYTVQLCMGSVEAKAWKCPYSLVRFAYALWPHTDGDPAYQKHDMLLIQVLRPWKLGATIQLAKLPSGKVDRNTYDKKKCIVGGWGLEGIGKIANSLKQATVIIYVGNPDKCKVENARQLCVVADSGITCSGDSGGPLVCDGILVGVLRGGLGVCNSTENKTSYFNMVQPYQDWIHTITSTISYNHIDRIVSNNLCPFIFPVLLLSIFN